MASALKEKVFPIPPAPFRIPLYVFALIIFTFLSLTSTEANAKDKPFEPFQATSIVWPLPPEPARIAYVDSINKPSDIKANKGFFKKFVGFLLGERVERIVKPYGIAVDSKDRLIVVDAATARVHIFDMLRGKYSDIVSSSKFSFNIPIDVAVDANDNIYVSDSQSGSVLVFNSKGRFQFIIEGFVRPTGLAIDNDDHILYVVDTGAHSIKVYDLRGTYIKKIGGRGFADGEFNFPTSIFVAGKGDIYVTDSMNFRVQKFNNDGRFLMALGSNGDGTGDMGRPKGVAVDSFGYIYVVDAIFDTVQIFDQDGLFLLNFGTTGSGPGEFWLPSAIFVDSKSRIYVADSYNERVQIFEYLGAKDEVLRR